MGMGRMQNGGIITFQFNFACQCQVHFSSYYYLFSPFIGCGTLNCCLLLFTNTLPVTSLSHICKEIIGAEEAF